MESSSKKAIRNVLSYLHHHSEFRGECRLTLRDQKYLTLVRKWTGWSRYIYDLAGQRIFVKGAEIHGHLRGRLPLQSSDTTINESVDSIMLLSLDETLLCVETEEGGYTARLPLEWFEETYEYCYENVSQYWICDGSRDIVAGHRWEAPLINGHRYCQDHLDRYFVHCVESGEYDDSREMVKTPRGWMTRLAVQTSEFRTCNSCGNLAHESLYISLCNSCGDQQQYDADNRSYSSEYHSCYHWKKHILDDEDEDVVLYGCEIEVDNGQREDSLDLEDIRSHDLVADIQSDGSLEQGFEVITHPSSHGYLKVHLGDVVQDSMEYMDCEYEHKAGFHVHVGRSHLSGDACKRLDYFVHRYREEVTQLAYRDSDEWAGFNKDINDRFDLFGKSNSRYEAINFNNDRTIEFRMFAPPPTKGRVDMYLDFVKSVVEYCRLTTNYHVQEENAWRDYVKYVKANRHTYDVLIKHRLFRDLMTEGV